MTCEGKKGRRQGLDERRKGDLYMKLFLQFSVFTIQTWISCLNLSHPLFHYFLLCLVLYVIPKQENKDFCHKELRVKLRQHGKYTKMSSFKRAEFTHMLRNRFTWKRVFFSWTEENRKKVRCALFHPHPSKSWKRLGKETACFQIVGSRELHPVGYCWWSGLSLREGLEWEVEGNLLPMEMLHSSA